VSFYLLLALYAAALGLIVGSYLNVVIYRVPRDLSTVRPRSTCPGCGRPIRALDNVPVLSFLVLRGRCRNCGAPIHWRYPAIEALTGALFVATFLRFGPTWGMLGGALFCALMVALAAIDVEHYILPDRITLPFTAVGIALQSLLLWAPAPSWLLGLAGRLGWNGDERVAAVLGGAFGAALGAGIIFAIWGGWYLVRKEEGMGLGDLKMLALIGAFVGWPGVLVCLFFASLTGAVIGVALLPFSGEGMKTRLPFGFFLALGALVTLFAGPEIVAWYAGLLAPEP
jgi:leader peptidase (prepilin peptidase)/N-methyltransferase